MLLTGSTILECLGSLPASVLWALGGLSHVLPLTFLFPRDLTQFCKYSLGATFPFALEYFLFIFSKRLSVFLTLCLQQRGLDWSHAAVWQPVRRVSYQLGCSCHWVYSQPPWNVFANNRGCCFAALHFFFSPQPVKNVLSLEFLLSPLFLLSNHLHFIILRIYAYRGHPLPFLISEVFALYFI